MVFKTSYSKWLKPKFLGTAIASLITLSGLAAALRIAPSYAQDNIQERILPLSPSVLAAIWEAPFSELFTVETADNATAYGVKDKDYDPGEPEIGFFSLWGDVPDRDRLQVAVKYCFPNRDIARSNAYLAEIILLDGADPLVTIDQELALTRAQMSEIQPAQYVRTYYGASHFYDPFWNPYYLSPSSLPATYIPAIECSLGGARFDLMPVKDAIARFPNKRLKVKLIFSNGLVENWHLGRGTVKALKELPTIRQAL